MCVENKKINFLGKKQNVTIFLNVILLAPPTQKQNDLDARETTSTNTFS